jgi:predicted ATP-dependent endonuclease of OLD family
VIYKSFKDLITIPPINSINQKQANIDLAWNWLVYGFQPNYTLGYTKCAATLQNNLKTKEYVFGGNNENEKSRFKKNFSDDFVLFPDDTFTKSVYSLFQDYLYKVSINKRIESGLTHLQKQIIPKNKPWEELNKLFKKLKFDYEFDEPFESGTYDLIDQPLLKSTLDSNLIIDTDKLSDGEKAIFSLAISVIEFGSKDLPFDILLLDEYDATLNPSLIESFHYVLQKYFIKNKVQVILTSHSVTTISLASENANVYEVYKPGREYRILNVNKNEYSDFEIANRNFYGEDFENE